MLNPYLSLKSSMKFFLLNCKEIISSEPMFNIKLMTVTLSKNLFLETSEDDILNKYPWWDTF